MKMCRNNLFSSIHVGNVLETSHQHFDALVDPSCSWGGDRNSPKCNEENHIQSLLGDVFMLDKISFYNHASCQE